MKLIAAMEMAPRWEFYACIWLSAMSRLSPIRPAHGVPTEFRSAYDGREKPLLGTKVKWEIIMPFTQSLYETTRLRLNQDFFVRRIALVSAPQRHLTTDGRPA